MDRPTEMPNATAPFVKPLFKSRPSISQTPGGPMVLHRPRWHYLLLLVLVLNVLFCLVDGFLFQKWDYAWLRLVVTPLGFLLIGQATSIHLDREAKLLSTRWSLNLKGLSQRSLADLQAVLVMSYGRLFCVHQVNLVFGSSAPPVVALVTIKSRRKAMELGERIAEFLGVPTLDRQCEYGPETTASSCPSTTRPLTGVATATWMSEAVLEVSVIVGLLSGVVGGLAGGNWLAQHGMGFLKGLAGRVLGLVCFALGMSAVWVFWLSLLLCWFMIKALLGGLQMTGGSAKQRSGSDKTDGSAANG
jgi:hypothetical protein